MAWTACRRPAGNAPRAQHVSAQGVCAITPWCDKEAEINVRRLRKDKDFVYFT